MGIIFVRYPFSFLGIGCFRLKNAKKTLYITFDDGPDPITTDKVLDLLNKYNAKATFFCLGKKAESNKYLLQKIIDNGHAVGNHGYEHLDAFKTKSRLWMKNLSEASSVSNYLLFRPPYGHIRPSQICKVRKKYKLIFWYVLTYDFKLDFTVKNVKKIIKNKVRDGSVIVFHENVYAATRMIPALEFLLKYYSRRGYSFNRIV